MCHKDGRLIGHAVLMAILSNCRVCGGGFVLFCADVGNSHVSIQ